MILPESLDVNLYGQHCIFSSTRWGQPGSFTQDQGVEKHQKNNDIVPQNLDLVTHHRINDYIYTLVVM